MLLSLFSQITFNRRVKTHINCRIRLAKLFTGWLLLVGFYELFPLTFLAPACFMVLLWHHLLLWVYLPCVLASLSCQHGMPSFVPFFHPMNILRLASMPFPLFIFFNSLRNNLTLNHASQVAHLFWFIFLSYLLPSVDICHWDKIP